VFFVCLVVTHSYKIGVDGGGTKTECILVDARGEIIARKLAPGCNPNQAGGEPARAILSAALAALMAQAKFAHQESMISHTLLCMAGNRDFWRETGAALRGYGRVTTCDDAQPVLELATSGAPGLVLHAGTGSFVAARAPDGSIHYKGGLGWKLGDPGSGYDLGRRALALAMMELQDPGPGGPAGLSPLVEALCAHTGLADYSANSRFFYHDPAANAQIAAFAPRVLELAAQDCGAAQQVLADSITDLARQADQVIHRLFPRPATRTPCGVSGRILNSAPAAYVLRSLASKLNWPVQLGFIATAPIEGVRRLLLASR
jgi:N-acetylglucosamine kinase-like BadF-type ATPase